MRARCEICGLRNTNEVVKEKGILFHHFPLARPDVCKKWLEVVGKESLWRLSPARLGFRYICSRHFSHSSYPGPCSKFLYRDVVPDRSLPEEASGPRPPGFVRKKPIVIPFTASWSLAKSSHPTTATIKTTSVPDAAAAAAAAISTCTTTTSDTTSIPATSATVNTSPTTTTDTASTPAANAVTCSTSTTTPVTTSIPAASVVTCSTSTTTTVTKSIPVASAVIYSTSTTTTVTKSIPVASAVTCSTATTTTVTKSVPAASDVTSTTSTTATVTTSAPAAGEALEADSEENFVGDNGESSENVKVTCRLCACNVNKEDVTPIFPPVYSSNESLLDKINILLPKKVKSGDGLPTHVCKTCVTKVENCVYTIKRFVFADKKLRSLLEKSQSAMHDHITLVQPHPLKVKKRDEAHRNKGRLHTLTIVAPEPLKVVEAHQPDHKKTSKNFISSQNSSDNASKKRYHPRKYLTIKTSYNSRPLYYRILPAKAARSYRKANSPEGKVSEDARDITTGEEDAHGIRPGEEGGVENIAGKGFNEECDVDSVLSNIFPCSFCSKAFPTRERRRIHEISDHVGETPIPAPKMRYQCYACKKRFRFAKHLKDHIRELHLPPEYKCEICRAIFTTKRRAVIHSRKHSGEKLFPCKYCNERFSLFKELLVHRRIHIRKRMKKPLSCQVCGKSFRERSQVHAHERIHKRTLCHLCGKSLPEALLKRHVEDHDRTHLCPFCGMTFKSSFNFYRHKHRMHQPHSHQAKTFQCSVCDRTFKTNRYLKNHMLAHSSLRNFKCDRCPSTFKYARNLQTHRKRHSMDSPMNFIAVAGTGPYTCLRCGKQFQSMAGYHLHNARHNANTARPFECPTCSRRYPSRPDLKRHMQRHAVSQQPSSFHICLRCGVFYKNKQTLDDHLCRFTDEKPFSCSFCGRTFFRRQFLLRHIQSFHNHEKPADLSTAITVSEDAGTENSLPNFEIKPVDQAVVGFQAAFLANLNSERVYNFNYEP